jgi:hypothetical protein
VEEKTKEAHNLIRELAKELVMCLTVIGRSGEVTELVERANRFLGRHEN